MEYKLRPYQQDCLNKILWSIRVNLEGNSIVVLPTGAGKSLILAKLADILNENILIIQPRRELVLQNYEKLSTYVDKNDIGIYSASLNSKEIKKYTLATIGSIYKKPKEFSHFKTIIIDEADLVPIKDLNSMFMSFLKDIGNPRIVGLTAIPVRQDVRYERLSTGSILTHTVLKMINRVHPRFWHRILYSISTQDLINGGYLTPFRYLDKTLFSHDETPVNKSRSDFDMDAFTKKLMKKEDEIIDSIFLARELAKHVLVFCPTVDMAEKLADIVPNSDVVTAKTKKKDRVRIIDDFRSGKLHTVFNVGIFTIGFDYPSIDAIVLLRPTKSIRLYGQMLGRGMRLSPGKKFCWLIDTTSTVKEMGRVETLSVQKTETGWDVVSEKGAFHNKILYRFELPSKF